MARGFSPTAVLMLALAGMGAAVACGDDDPGAAPPIASAEAGAEVEASAAPFCVDGKAIAYPPEPYELGVLGTVPRGLSFESGTGPVTIESYFEPCAERSRILIVRSSASWCGPCGWHAAHTKRFMEDGRFTNRVLLLDLLIADRDNVPATMPALDVWKQQVDYAGPPEVWKQAIDPAYRFGPALLARAPLPEYVFIDTRTMKVLSTMPDPDPESLVARLAIELADLDKSPRPPDVAPTLIDKHFTENEMDLIRGMRLVPAPPPDTTNEYGDLAAAVTLGKALFSDKALTPLSKVSCETCHDSGLELGDALPTSTGLEKVDRNSPGVMLSAHSRWQFWDGRADTLWMQALLPFEDAKEMGSNRLFIAHQVAERYQAQYDAVFGAKYPIPIAEIALLPANGKPGDPAFTDLSQADKDKVTRIYVNVGKAIAAFERAIRVLPNSLDDYIDGNPNSLTDDQKHSLSIFMKNGCAQCHWGPRLTNDAFHTLRFPTGRQDGAADTGRESGLQKLALAEFLATSKWSDDPTAAKPFVIDQPNMLGAFKTPSLRGVTSSQPYGHGGTFKVLNEVTQHYSIRGLEHGDPKAIGTTEQWVPNFDANVTRDLVPFLDVLSAKIVLPP